jgi:lysophospholipase L1-like esterase
MKRIVAPLCVVAIAFAWGGGIFWAMGKPGFWGFQIAHYERADRLQPPPQGVIVFTGSSSIRFWHTLPEDMKPLEVINRGFGGSQIAQVNHYAPRIILPYRPRAVVLYCGDNDLSWPWLKSPEQVSRDFQEFVRIIHTQLPETWIYYISMKPSVLRWTHWDKVLTTNRLIEEYIQTQARVEYIDVDRAMLNAEGKPRPELFGWDGLHMNAKGYEVWTGIVKPVLLKRFGAAINKAATGYSTSRVGN